VWRAAFTTPDVGRDSPADQKEANPIIWQTHLPALKLHLDADGIEASEYDRLLTDFYVFSSSVAALSTGAKICHTSDVSAWREATAE